MQHLFFVLDIDPPPTTAQTKRFGGKRPDGRLIFYDSNKLREARWRISSGLIPYRPKEPITGAVRLLVVWNFPTKDRKKWGKLKTTRPDTDNLQKMLKDEMTKLGFWKDDAQVCVEIVQKYWSEHGSIEIVVDELDG